jgi:hypothetical protein
LSLSGLTIAVMSFIAPSPPGGGGKRRCRVVPGGQAAVTRILFSARVPVLSAQITDVEPLRTCPLLAPRRRRA